MKKQITFILLILSAATLYARTGGPETRKEAEALFNKALPGILSDGYVLDSAHYSTGDLNGDGLEDALVTYVLKHPDNANSVNRGWVIYTNSSAGLKKFLDSDQSSIHLYVADIKDGIVVDNDYRKRANNTGQVRYYKLVGKTLLERKK